ncbi:hypothetical protein IV203_003855 [Nitzschia inconspicua]|uniref:Uncharacterized protein n=1 Tax=Nitzschia inconspicua TaxID=303405 RepID=A0A9K3L2N5_9STRA|nr:hypothetical protein IV203_003855 [Nitzschia inconspicua]
MADGHANVMAQIEGLGHQEAATADAKVVHVPDVKSPSVGGNKARGDMSGISGLATGQDGTLKEEWNPYLPRPPSVLRVSNKKSLLET